MLASAAVLMALAAAPATSTDGPTIGAVARGILDPRVPGVLETWRAALENPRPELRAAAARAVNVSGVRNLGPEVLEALKAESDPGARQELLRAAVVIGATSGDAELIASVRDSREAGVLAMALLRVRGVSATASHLIPLFEAGFIPSSEYLDELLVEPGLRERLARHALDTADAPLWSALLSAGESVRPLLGQALLQEALRAEQGRLREKTLWYVARHASQGGPKASALRAVLPLSAAPAAATLRELLAREMAARAFGEPMREVPGWLDSLKSKEPLWPDLDLQDEAVHKLFTRAEKAALHEELERPKPRLLHAGKKSSPLPAMWFLTGFPAGYRAGVFEATGCRPGENDVGGVEIAFKPDGRPRTFAASPDGVSADCREALRLLAASSLVPDSVRPMPSEAFLVAVLDPAFLACQDEPPPAASAKKSEAGTGSVQPPRKIRNVPPQYPEDAKRLGIQGVVILEAVVSPSGCIRDLRLLDADHGRLIWVAMRAVSQWRYSPTLLNGEAVPVTMTVTVNFRLH